MSIFQLNYITESPEEWRQNELSFFSGFYGLSQTVIDSGRIYQEYPAMTQMLRINSRISFNPNHPVLKGIAKNEKPATLAIPAPACLLSLLLNETGWHRYYTVADELVSDIAKAYGQLFDAAYKLGFGKILLNDYSWLSLMDDMQYNRLIQGGVDVNHYTSLLIDVNNRAMKSFSSELEIIHHIGRCEDMQSFMVGSYSQIASWLFPTIQADIVRLDFDTVTNNDYSVLAYFLDHVSIELSCDVRSLSEYAVKTLEVETIKAAKCHTKNQIRFIPQDRLTCF